MVWPGTGIASKSLLKFCTLDSSLALLSSKPWGQQPKPDK